MNMLDVIGYKPLNLIVCEIAYYIYLVFAFCSDRRLKNIILNGESTAGVRNIVI